MELSTYRKIYQKQQPYFERQLIGCIDLPNLRFAKNIGERDVQFDLNHLFNDRIKKPNIVDPKLDNLLKFLQEYEIKLNFDTATNLNESKFFCYRGLMTNICSSPYEYRENWKIAVMLFKGNIYLCQRATEEKLQQLQNITEEQEKNTSAGHKFEQFIFAETPDTEPNPDEPCDESKEFNGIFRAKLNDHTIIFGAEMDGVACDKSNVKLPPNNGTFEEIKQYLQQLEFLEAKTNLHFDIDKKVKHSFGLHKSGKWWCQSYLVGINRIICGFKNSDRIVQKLKVFSIDEIERMSKWNTNVCLNFLDEFFSYVKRCLHSVIKRDFGEEALDHIQDLDLVSFLLEWRPNSRVKISHNWNHGDDVILPDWFRNSFGSHSACNAQRIERSKDDKTHGHSSNRSSYKCDKRPHHYYQHEHTARSNYRSDRQQFRPRGRHGIQNRRDRRKPY